MKKALQAILAAALAAVMLMTLNDTVRADPAGRYRFDGPHWSGRGAWSPRGGLHFGRGEIRNNEFFYAYGRYGGHLRGFVYSPDLGRGWALGAGPNYRGFAHWGEGFARYRVERAPTPPPLHYWAPFPRSYTGTFYQWGTVAPGYCGPGGFYPGSYGYSYYYRW